MHDIFFKERALSLLNYTVGGNVGYIQGKKLKYDVLGNLKRNGYSFHKTSFTDANGTKSEIRSIHYPQRLEKIKSMKTFIEENVDYASNFFASGEDIEPEKIRPEIVEVRSGRKENSLFRFATLNWSVPVSNGFGRRMRFLVFDKYNKKLIGIIGLGDPVFNLSMFN